MATIGKWGITRDTNGELADLYSWPWFWRYPIVIVGIALVCVGVYIADSNTSIEDWVIVIFAVLFGIGLLTITYELAMVLFFAGCIWGLSQIFGAVVPDSWQKATKTELAEVRATANHALFVATSANNAVHDGASSGTTMGEEVQEAKSEAEDARIQALDASAEAAQAQADIVELETRLETICNKAPALCY